MEIKHPLSRIALITIRIPFEIFQYQNPLKLKLGIYNESLYRLRRRGMRVGPLFFFVSPVCSVSFSECSQRWGRRSIFLGLHTSD